LISIKSEELLTDGATVGYCVMMTTNVVTSPEVSFKKMSTYNAVSSIGGV
jgi:hypothetical protein